MEQKIINEYLNESVSIENLSLKYKIGKIKIKQILFNNGIELKKRGGQKKHIFIPLKYNLINKIAECKCCGKKFNDIENKSGSLTEHIKICFPDVKIPNKTYRSNYKNDNGEYWHFKYYNIINKEEKKFLKCPECEWKTLDLVNKSGSFTKHILKNHNSIENFLKNHPSYEVYFNPYNKDNEYEKKIKINNNNVTCQICGKKMKSINNSHLKIHNLSVNEYKLKYPLDKIVSKSTSEILRKNAIIINSTIDPTWTSNGEIEIINFIKGLGVECEKSKNRKLLNGKEIDIIINSHKIGIEYDGLYYHTEKMGKNRTYHLNKTIECNNIGYGLIHIFEDEWVLKKEIVKSKIKHILKLSDGVKIGARNTIVKKINSFEKSKFLNENHLQGNDKSTIYYGAYFNENLIGVMTFNSKRNMTKSIIDEYELSRFCIKINYIIPGLSSKILKQFIKDYSPKSIISFADRRWTINHDSNLYTKIGFELVGIIEPTYYYYNSKINKYKRYHKFGFGKNSLKKKYPDLDFSKSEKELTLEMGFDKIWDCGLYKYKLTI